MINKLYTTLFVAFIFIFAFTGPANAMFHGGSSNPTHGWNGQPIRLDYSMGGPNILINETTGLTVSHISSGDYNAFGYFSYNPTTGAFAENTINFDSAGQAYIGEFEEGTYVGTWLSSDYGKFYSIPSLNQGNAYRAAYLGDTPEGNLKIGMEGGHPWGGTNYNEMVASFEPTQHAPAGQPLPGVLISALIGLGLTGIAGVRKHKNR